MKQEIRELFTQYKNVILIGEAGSGKTEVALNLAVNLKQNTDYPVELFDMDQTKPLFRARDAEKMLQKAGVLFHYQPQLLDTPIVPDGVKESLLDDTTCTILDIGGNEQGARMMGQFASVLKGSSSIALFVVNPFRPWSGNLQGIEATIATIVKAARFDQIRIISNPNLGGQTTVEDILEGHHKLMEILKELTPDFLCVTESLSREIKNRAELPVLAIKPYLKYSWQTVEE